MDGCVACGVKGTIKGGKGRHTDYKTTRYRKISTQNNDAEFFFSHARTCCYCSPLPGSVTVFSLHPPCIDNFFEFLGGLGYTFWFKSCWPALLALWCCEAKCIARSIMSSFDRNLEPIICLEF